MPARPRSSPRRLGLLRLEDRLAPAVWSVDQVLAGSVQTGSPAQPFGTIQQGANAAQPGDTVLVAGGTYREAVTVPTSGTAASPIRFAPNGPAVVTVSGADPVTGWAAAGGGVYQAAMPWGYAGDNQSNQVFVGGQMLNLARWPTETTGDRVRAPDEATVDSAAGLVSQGAAAGADVTITDAEFNEPAGRWVGAKVWVNLARGGWDGQGQTGTVVAHSGNTITVRGIDNRGGDGAWSVGPGTRYYLFGPTAAGLAASGGVAAALDPGEWYRDAAAGQLYVRLADGSAPVDAAGDRNQVEAKRRTNGFVLDGRTHVAVEGLRFNAATLTTDLKANARWGTAATNPGGTNGVAPAADLTLSGLSFQYVTHFTDQTGNYQMQWQQQSGVILSGTDITLSDSTVRHSAGSGLSVIGRRVRVLNGVFRDLNESASEAGAVNFGRAYAPGLAVSQDHEFAYNHVFDTPQQGLNIRALRNSANAPGTNLARVHHNVIHDVMLRSGDSGAIDTFGVDGQYTRIDHNVIYNVLGPIAVGIYMDFNSRYLIDHNLVYNVGVPILVNWEATSTAADGTNNNAISIYNNTAISQFPTDYGIGNGFSTSNAGTIAVNNVSTRGVNLGGALAANTAAADSLFAAAAAADYRLAAGTNPAADTAVPAGPAYPGLVHDPLSGPPDRGAVERGLPAWAAGSSLVPARAVPTGLTAARPALGRAVLAWTNDAAGHARNEVWRSADNGLTWAPVAVLPPTTTAYTDWGLFGQRYLYRVRADDSPFSPAAAASYTVAARDLTPGAYDAQSGSLVVYGAGNANLGGTSPGSWARYDSIDFGAAGSVTQMVAAFTSGAAGSTITARLDSLTGPVVATVTSANGTWAAQTPTVPVTGAGGVRTLFLVFSSWGTANLSGFGFRPLVLPAAAPPAAPTGLTAAAGPATAVRLAWTPTPGAGGQAVERSTDWANFVRLAALDNTAAAFTDADVIGGTTYYYRVRAVRDGVAGPSTPLARVFAPAEVTASVAVGRRQPVYDRRTGMYAQDVFLTNTSAADIPTGLRVRLDRLTPGVRLADATLVTDTAAVPLDVAPGEPVVQLPRAVLPLLAAGQRVRLTVRLSNPNALPLNYTARTFSDPTLE